MSRSVTIFLAGGLGNNLFQIALGEYLKSIGRQVTYNSYLVSSNTTTRFLKWSIHESKMTTALLDGEKISSKLTIVDVFFLLFQFARSKLLGKGALMEFSPEIGCSSLRLFGYWQKGVHLNDKSFFCLSKKIEGLLSVFSNTAHKVVLHVRHGDFPECERLTSTNYYSEAIKSVGCEKVVVVAAPKTILDPDFLGQKCHFEHASTQSMLEDFSLIYYSDCVVVSNSTFCYWAANLGYSKMVVFPSKLGRGRDWDLPWDTKKNTSLVDAVF